MDYFDTAYDFIRSSNRIYSEAKATYNTLKGAGKAAGFAYNYFNDPRNYKSSSMGDKAGNMRGAKSKRSISDALVPTSGAFKSYKFNGPTKVIYQKPKIPRVLRSTYKPVVYMGCREMDIVPLNNGDCADQYLNILSVPEIFSCKAMALEHINVQTPGTNTASKWWTTCIHNDKHVFNIANACSQPIVVECFILQYKDDDTTNFSSWRDFTEYEQGVPSTNMSGVSVTMDRRSPRFDILKHRRSILQNYKLIDRRRLTLGPGQNSNYTFINSGDQIISNAHLDELTTTTYTASGDVFPATISYGRDYMRGMSKVFYIRTWCGLLAEETGVTAVTGDDIGIGKAKVLVREEVTRVIGAYPITRCHRVMPGNRGLENTSYNNNPGGASIIHSGVVNQFYNDYKQIAGATSYVDIENDQVRAAGTSTT